MEKNISPKLKLMIVAMAIDPLIEIARKCWVSDPEIHAEVGARVDLDRLSKVPTQSFISNAPVGVVTSM
jgi:hypothetical protein